MIGAMIENGMRRMAANSGTQVKTTIRPTTLPRYMEAIRPHTKSFCSTNSMGPGCRPQIIRPPSSTAAVGEPVAHEGGGRGATRRDAHPAADDAAADRGHPVLEQRLPGLQHGVQADGGSRALELEPALHGGQDL